MNCGNGIIYTWFRRRFAASRYDFGAMTMNYGEMKRAERVLSAKCGAFLRAVPAIGEKASRPMAVKLYHECRKFSRDCAKLSPELSIKYLSMAAAFKGMALAGLDAKAAPKKQTRKTTYTPRRGHRIRTKEIRLNDPQERVRY